MLIESLFHHAQVQPQRLAVIDDQGRFTYGQLGAMAAGMAGLIASRTSRPKVGLLLPPSAAFVGAFHGALLVGKTAVPINYLLGEREIAHIIRDSGIDTVVTIPFFAGRLAGMPLNVIDVAQLPPPAPQTAPPEANSLSRDDVAVLLYTSGTSGLPKGVLLTCGNLDSVVEAAIQHAGLRSQHTFYGLIPLFHSFGITAMMLGPIRLGATIVYQARFSPLAALHAIKEHKPSLVFAIPSMYSAMLRLKDAGPEDFSSTYAVISGGEPLPEVVRESFQKRFGVTLHEGYGLTETCAVIALNTPQSHKPGSVGRPLPGATVRITNEAGAPVPSGEAGEIWVSGPMIMKGYHNLPEETASALTPDRFFKTGDLGVMDAEGFLHIVGRAKDLIIVSGEKVYPREIEDALRRHPNVADVAVLGKKDAGRGEIVVAFVMPREGQAINVDELLTFAREQGLVQWKIPREIIIAPDLPRSPTGKVLRRELAERLAAGGPAAGG